MMCIGYWLLTAMRKRRFGRPLGKPSGGGKPVSPQTTRCLVPNLRPILPEQDSGRFFCVRHGWLESLPFVEVRGLITAKLRPIYQILVEEANAQGTA
jgi:hypothetical protein